MRSCARDTLAMLVQRAKAKMVRQWRAPVADHWSLNSATAHLFRHNVRFWHKADIGALVSRQVFQHQLH